MPVDPKNLGPKVSSRDISWLDLTSRAWGSELNAPDHNIYEFSNGRRFDSTDKGLTGLYGVPGENLLIADGARYPDMRDGIEQTIALNAPNGSLNQPFGRFPELVPESNPLPNPFADPITGDFDPYFQQVVLLVHDDFVDKSRYAIPYVSEGVGQQIYTGAPPFLGSSQAMGQLNAVSSVGGSRGYLNSALYDIFVQSSPTPPFTVEYSIYVTAAPPSSYFFMSFGSSLENNCYMGVGPSPIANAPTGYPVVMTNASPLSVGRWYQIAFCYDGSLGNGTTGLTRTFVDGTLISSAGTTAKFFANGTVPRFSLFTISNTSGGLTAFRGYIKEVRLTAGVSRYGVSYAPRSTPFPDQ